MKKVLALVLVLALCLTAFVSLAEGVASFLLETCDL